jgi:signal transduction histidine kinase
VHELNHKINTVNAGIHRLKAQVAHPPDWKDAERAQHWLVNLDKMTDEINGDTGEISALIDAFDRQSKYIYEPVDVNGVVKKVARQLKEMAKDMKTMICCDIDLMLPKAFGVSLQVEQIVFNLVLNAIQMIDSYIDDLKKANKFLNLPIPFVQNGVVLIQTRCVGENDLRFIEIRVIDNGPGIHWNEQYEIFLEDVSRRGGAGRGLSVSRNLAERMGGSLTLLNSIRFLGSAFVVELPVFQVGNMNDKS